MYVTQELRDVILEIGIVDDLLSEREQRGEKKCAAGVLALLDSGCTAEEIRKMLTAGVLPHVDKI
jgi:hypothetical protein